MIKTTGKTRIVAFTTPNGHRYISQFEPNDPQSFAEHLMSKVADPKSDIDVDLYFEVIDLIKKHSSE